MNIDARAGRQLCVLACLVLALALAGCMREPETALRIGTNVWIGSEPLYLARELGRLDPATVQLVEYPSASEVLRAFRNQAIDGMVISLDELFELAVDGLQPRIILVVDVSHGADVVVGRRGMKTMRDLKDKSVDVESAVTFDPYRAQFLKAGAATLFDSTQIPGEIVDLLAVRASVIDKEPKAIQALLTGWFGAIDYIKREPVDAARRMGIRQQTSGEQFQQAQRGLHVPSREENLRMLGGAQPELATTGRRLMALMLEAKLLRSDLEIERVLEPGPLATLP